MSSLDLQNAQAAIAASFTQHWRAFLTEGIVLLLLGLLAIIVPPIATLAVEILIGWILLASGIVGLISTFRMRGAPGFGWSLVSAVIGIAAGVILLAWPLSGAVSLTLVLSVFLLFEGIASIMLALGYRDQAAVMVEQNATGRGGALVDSHYEALGHPLCLLARVECMVLTSVTHRGRGKLPAPRRVPA